MRRESTEAILSNDILGTVDDRNAVVAIVAIVSVDGDVVTGHVDT